MVMSNTKQQLCISTLFCTYPVPLPPLISVLGLLPSDNATSGCTLVNVQKALCKITVTHSELHEEAKSKYQIKLNRSLLFVNIQSIKMKMFL